MDPVEDAKSNETAGGGRRCESLSPFDVHRVKGPPHLIRCMKVRCSLPVGHCGEHKGTDGSTWRD